MARPRRQKKPPRRRRPPKRPSGMVPGTLVVDPGADASSLRCFLRRDSVFEETEIASTTELEATLRDCELAWVDVTGLADTDLLRQLAALLGLHPLVLEDIGNVRQRPKVEGYGEDLLLFARMTDETRPIEDPLLTEQLVLLVRPGLVVTFQERRGDSFEPVRNRLRSGSLRLRTSGSDYLAYALLDAVVDRYLSVADDFEETIEILEDEILTSPSDLHLEHLHQLRRDLLTLRRATAPLREVLSTLVRETEPPGLFRAETQLFLRDCLDHAIRAVEQIDGSREMLNGLLELRLSTLSHHTNEAMRTLTVIATIFIPLSFLAGLYGMNFDTSSPWNMPELAWRYGYPALLGAMVLVVALLLWFLRRRTWL